MQKTEIIDISSIKNIIELLCENDVVIYEAYSEFDSDIIKFPNPNFINNYIDNKIKNSDTFIDLVAYYPDTKGFIEKKKILLDQKRCNGSKYRYSMEGWGLIQIQMDCRNSPNIEARIAVNSEKRANNWSIQYPELKSPELWDWKLVEKYTRRLIRIMQKYRHNGN